MLKEGWVCGKNFGQTCLASLDIHSGPHIASKIPRELDLLQAPLVVQQQWGPQWTRCYGMEIFPFGTQKVSRKGKFPLLAEAGVAATRSDQASGVRHVRLL